jgi:hypothetical protein
MEPYLIVIKEIMVVGVGVVGIINIMWDILKILQKTISHISTRSGIPMKKNNKKMAKVYKINLQKAISVVWKVIGHVPVVRLNIWQTCTKPPLKKGK